MEKETEDAADAPEKKTWDTPELKEDDVQLGGGVITSVVESSFGTVS